MLRSIPGKALARHGDTVLGTHRCSRRFARSTRRSNRPFRPGRRPLVLDLRVRAGGQRLRWFPV